MKNYINKEHLFDRAAGELSFVVNTGDSDKDLGTYTEEDDHAINDVKPLPTDSN